MRANQSAVMVRRRQGEDDMDAPFRAKPNQDRVTLGVQFPLDFLQPADPGLHFDQDDAPL